MADAHLSAVYRLRCSIREPNEDELLKDEEGKKRKKRSELVAVSPTRPESLKVSVATMDRFVMKDKHAEAIIAAWKFKAPVIDRVRPSKDDVSYICFNLEGWYSGTRGRPATQGHDLRRHFQDWTNEPTELNVARFHVSLRTHITKLIYKLCVERSSGHNLDPEDITSDIFFKIIHTLSTDTLQVRSIAAYVKTSVRHHWQNVIRARKWNPVPFIEELPESTDGSVPVVSEQDFATMHATSELDNSTWKNPSTADIAMLPLSLQKGTEMLAFGHSLSEIDAALGLAPRSFERRVQRHLAKGDAVPVVIDTISAATVRSFVVLYPTPAQRQFLQMAA